MTVNYEPNMLNLICLPACLPACLSVCLPICLRVCFYFFTCLPSCLSACCAYMSMTHEFQSIA